MIDILSCATGPGPGRVAQAEALSPLAASATPPTALSPAVGGAQTTQTRWSAGCRTPRGLCPSSAEHQDPPGGRDLVLTARSCLHWGVAGTTGHPDRDPARGRVSQAAPGRSRTAQRTGCTYSPARPAGTRSPALRALTRAAGLRARWTCTICGTEYEGPHCPNCGWW